MLYFLFEKRCFILYLSVLLLQLLHSSVNANLLIQPQTFKKQKSYILLYTNRLHIKYSKCKLKCKHIYLYCYR